MDDLKKQSIEPTPAAVEFWYHTEKHEHPVAFLVGVYGKNVTKEVAEEHLDELKLLVKTYQMPIAGAWCTSLRDISSATFLSSGKLLQLKAYIQESGAKLVIFDDEISPVQQRNLEKELGRTVMDRTEVILGVFAAHARTHEAKLQIALAQSKYMAPRLKRLWTHLSRQTGGGGGATGGGYLKGVGEKQIEIDRRLLKQRVEKLERDLVSVRAIRKTQKAQRERQQVPVFAIVGYTNSGKSTLMNQLTGAHVLVEDKLFATLDTTTRQHILPNHQAILLSDTVGFIRKLPHLLVASFKSTLEEAVDADFLLHLVDASHPQAIEQAHTTMEVLRELKAKDKDILTVLNKIDRAEGESKELVLANIQKLRLSYPKAVQISAKTGEGIESLNEAMMHMLSERQMRVSLRIPQTDYRVVAEILAQATLYSKEYDENDILLDVELPRAVAAKYLISYNREPSKAHQKEVWE